MRFTRAPKCRGPQSLQMSTFAHDIIYVETSFQVTNSF
jgi:hypothetical protein